MLEESSMSEMGESELTEEESMFEPLRIPSSQETKIGISEFSEM